MLFHLACPPLLQHLSNGDCLEDEREDYQNRCAVVYDSNLCTIMRIHPETRKQFSAMCSTSFFICYCVTELGFVSLGPFIA